MTHTGQPVPNEDGTFKKDVCLNCYMPEEPCPYTYKDYSCSRHCQRVDEEHDSCEKEKRPLIRHERTGNYGLYEEQPLDDPLKEYWQKENKLLPSDWVKKEFQNPNQAPLDEVVYVILDYLDHIIPELQRQIDEVKLRANRE